MEIFERNVGFNNKEMYEHCKLLQDTISITEQYKEGRGRNVKTFSRFKHNIPSEVRDKINNSCEHYKKLHEKDMERNNQIKLRDYQVDIIKQGSNIVKEFGFVYLAMEVRCGKTLTSLGIAETINSSNVLFLTKKKAISSIQKDYELLNPPYHLTVTNYENLHKIESTGWDLIILDEAHSCFLENTLIDGVKIKDIELGSFQKSFNFAKGIYEYKKVLNVFKNPLTENLIKIKCNGKEIVCTESHKIFTRRGWVKAGELLPTDELQVL
jgi:intein/homing endonuclease